MAEIYPQTNPYLTYLARLVQGPAGPAGPAGPSGPGGGPGYGIMYVYAVFGYEPAEEPDGSAANPFLSFTEAHDALPAAGGVIYVLASDGSSDASGLDFTKPLAVIADWPQLWGDGAHGVTSTEALYVENMTVTTDEGGQPGLLQAASLVCVLCTAAFRTTVGSLDLTQCRTSSGTSGVVAGSATLRNCALGSTSLTAAGLVKLVDCTVTGPVISSGDDLDLADCVISANLTAAGTNARFSSCRWTSGTRTLTFSGDPGVMFVDAMSNYWWKLATETLTNGTKTIQADTSA